MFDFQAFETHIATVTKSLDERFPNYDHRVEFNSERQFARWGIIGRIREGVRVDSAIIFEKTLDEALTEYEKLVKSCL